MKARLVLDTNIFISAVLFKGEVSKLVDSWKKSDVKILMSKQVLEEYVKVLSYPKFKLSEKEIEYIIEEELLPFVEVIKVASEVSLVKDLDDNKFIALAIDGNANYIISGDAYLLNLKEFEEIKIIPIKEFLL